MGLSTIQCSFRIVGIVGIVGSVFSDSYGVGCVWATLLASGNVKHAIFVRPSSMSTSGAARSRVGFCALSGGGISAAQIGSIGMVAIAFQAIGAPHFSAAAAGGNAVPNALRGSVGR